MKKGSWRFGAAIGGVGPGFCRSAIPAEWKRPPCAVSQPVEKDPQPKIWCGYTFYESCQVDFVLTIATFTALHHHAAATAAACTFGTPPLLRGSCSGRRTNIFSRQHSTGCSLSILEYMAKRDEWAEPSLVVLACILDSTGTQTP